MKVYIISGWYYYDGADILGVYLSEEKAEAAAELERAKGDYDGVEVREWEVQE
ncbi:hypothetical protein QA035_gp05 [Salmonella phage vB_SenS_PVP-SE2]|uniref:DUF7336 domain-containing protein n=1 Tax=Salmonella phage vB_SenS_PVP-SE2 TaxID=2024214 RepID=A0A223G0H7_9CAUD|nr:hypothetical protein QA035_gp05 [Salmonella phage vB_SenS_PVP-SE2]AST15513.1 hypothetical protein PVPSE2_05 [Salmonella phage vB_SenS_PVP-SE2]